MRLWHSGLGPRHKGMRFIVLVILALVGIGCSGGGVAAKPKVMKAVYLGQWRGKIDDSGVDLKNPEASQAVGIARQFEAMNDLEFLPGDKFAMCAGGYLIEGAFRGEENSVVLEPATVNGISIAKASEVGLNPQKDLVAPFKLMRQADGSLAMAAGKYGEKLAYLRWEMPIPAEYVEGLPIELAGDWRVKSVVGLTIAQKRQGHDRILNRTRLRLHREAVYEMRFNYLFNGEWKLEKGNIVLIYPSGEMKVKSLKDGTLEMSSPDGSTKVILARK